MSGRSLARLALAAAALSAAVPAAAESLSLTLATGTFRPVSAQVRQVYRTRLPVSFMLRARLKGPFGVFMGVESWPSRGTAVNVSGGGGEKYALRLGLDTLPVGAFLRLPAGPVVVGAAAGAVHFRYEESWETIDLRVHDRTWGWFAALTLDVPFLRRLAFTGLLRYDGLPTGTGSSFAPDVDLGGLRALIGLTVALF